ncbi:MAG: hypothetical protein RL001_60, partial [Pseudomonadota bacterium]
SLTAINMGVSQYLVIFYRKNGICDHKYDLLLFPASLWRSLGTQGGSGGAGNRFPAIVPARDRCIHCNAECAFKSSDVENWHGLRRRDLRTSGHCARTSLKNARAVSNQKFIYCFSDSVNPPPSERYRSTVFVSLSSCDCTSACSALNNSRSASSTSR